MFRKHVSPPFTKRRHQQLFVGVCVSLSYLFILSNIGPPKFAAAFCSKEDDEVPLPAVQSVLVIIPNGWYLQLRLVCMSYSSCSCINASYNEMASEFERPLKEKQYFTFNDDVTAVSREGLHCPYEIISLSRIRVDVRHASQFPWLFTNHPMNLHYNRCVV